MKKTYSGLIILALVLLVLFFGCTQTTNTPPTVCPMDAKLCPDGGYVSRQGPNCEFASCPSEKQVIVGGDKDSHGCIGSAGYTWCEDLNKCIRPWEEKCAVVACTMDAKMCPNGVYVGRIAPDCNFAPCPQTDNQAQVANPASTNCVDKGGTLQIVDTNAGQVGMCSLPNGHTCEEWAYFRGECN